MVEREGSTPSPDTNPNPNPMQVTQSIPQAHVIPGITQGERSKHSLVEMAQLIASELQTSIDELRQPTRKQEIRSKRQTAMYLLKLYGGFTLTQIGGLFYKDHATVLHSCRVVEWDMLTSKRLRDFINTMKETKLLKSS